MYKPFLESLFIFVLFLLPMTQAAANDLPREVNLLQAKLMEADEKIASLATDQQRSARAISDLKTGLNTAHQEIIDLKNSGVFKHQPSRVQRTANGHGR